MRRAMRVFALDEVELYYQCALHVAGTSCEVATNSRELIETLASWRVPSDCHGRSFKMRVLVTNGGGPRASQPYFRGMHHLVVARFGDDDLMVFDLLGRNVAAVVTKTTAADTKFWNRVALPIAIGILGPTVGTVPVHCACLALDGEGLLIAGQSGAGKSTLALALAQSGFTLVSDDWTYMTRNGVLSANGLFAPVKLLPDAIQHFPRLAQATVASSLNGELAYEVEPAAFFGVSVSDSCQPRMFVFLERIDTPKMEIAPVSAQVAAEYLESSVERVPDVLAGLHHERSKVLAIIAKLPCWLLRYGGKPTFAASELRQFIVRHMEALV